MSNRKKQTAVEYLHKEYMKVFGELEINTVQFYDLGNALDQAKAMEKEQIINGWDNGFLDYQISMHEDAEQYYNETFGE